MSLSMWAWRVVFPGAGLLACVVALGLSLQPGDGRERDLNGRATNPPSPAGRSSEDRIVAEGRIVPRPGAEVTVSSELGGVAASVPVRVKGRVKKGDVLVVFRSEDREAELAGSEAKLAEADADLAYLKREFQRRVKAPTDSQHYASELDSVRRDHEVAVARQRAAVFNVAHARAALARARITTPIDGVVLACHIQPGESAAPGERLVTVCDLSRTCIEAEVDEFDAPRVAVGAEVTITAEGFGPASWRGTVEEVPDRVSDRNIRPEDPGRPIDASVLLVKIALTEPVPLKLGQRLEVEIRSPAPVSSPPAP